MSNSALNQGVLQAKISNVQNAADSSAVYSAGVWSFKNSTAVTSVTITDAGNVGIGTTSPKGSLHVGGNAIINNGAGFLGNLYYSGSWKYASSGTALAFGVFSDTTGLSFSTAPGGGTADAAATVTERMRIDANGNLLLGKTTASDAVGAGVYVTPAGGIYSTQTGSINYLTCYNTTASAYRFYVTAAGQINATSTSIAAISDASLKENVRDLETGLSQVLALKPRRFDWKEETQIDQKDVAGFIAQEVEEILPELVYEYKYNETETKKSLKMGDMLPTLVKAIQELSAKVDAQAAEIEALKAS